MILMLPIGIDPAGRQNEHPIAPRRDLPNGYKRIFRHMRKVRVFLLKFVHHIHKRRNALRLLRQIAMDIKGIRADADGQLFIDDRLPVIALDPLGNGKGHPVRALHRPPSVYIFPEQRQNFRTAELLPLFPGSDGFSADGS